MRLPVVSHLFTAPALCTGLAGLSCPAAETEAGFKSMFNGKDLTGWAVQIGLVGVGRRARWIMTKEDLPGAQIVSVADCFRPRCAEAAKIVPGGDKRGKYRDYRKMLEKEKLDAVFVETTTHARVLAMTHADVETGHRATTLCHRVNLCRTMQRTLR